jgi:hypothetical protein
MSNTADLDVQVELMMNYISELEPDVRVKFNPRIYEDEHANINVYPPLSWDDDRCLDLQEKIGAHIVDVLLDTGFLILVYVYMPEQQIAAAQRERELAEKALKSVEQRREAAEQLLAQAKELGLIPIEMN